MGFFARFSDGLANIVSGLGTTADRRSYARYHFRPLDWGEIAAAYRTSWMVKKGVNLPPYDMTRAGRDWQADKKTIAALEAEEKRLQLWAKIRMGLVWGRLGGGVMILGIGNDDPSTPLDPTSIKAKGIKHATLWTRWQVRIGPKVTDTRDDRYGGPEYYALNTAGVPTQVHPSRVIAFRGSPVWAGTAMSWEDEFWGDSVLQSVEDAIKNADTAQNGFAALIGEAKVDIYKIPGLTALAATAEFEKALSKRMETSNLFKSQFNALLLDAGNGTEGSGEDWDQRQVTWTGIPAIVMMYVSLVAGAFDIPATRFIGKAPDGMNATGEGDENNYWSMIRSLQDSDVRPILDQIDPILIPSALGKADDGVWWKFAPLEETSEEDEATTFDTTMDAVVKLQGTGTIPDVALSKGVQNLMEERGWLPGLDDALAEISEDERFPEAEPDEEDDLPASNVVQLQPAKIPTTAKKRTAHDARFTDAAPQTLYVCRKLLNAADFIAWAKSQGFETTTPADELHVTVCFSRQPIDWMTVGNDWASDAKGELTVAAGGPRLVQALGDKGAVVLLFGSSDLLWRHNQFVDLGASHDFSEYQPHVTITYQAPADLDLSKVQPYAGPLKFGPELFSRVVDDWEKGVTEE